MSSPAQGLDPREQRYRNLVTFVVLGSVIGGIALVYVLLLQGSQAVYGICSLVFLAFAFVAWEFLMKPGYGLQARLRERREQDSEGPEEPRLPGPP
jgi:hypothetical protein